MGTSLSWRTDSQLHDAVKRQLDEDPEIRAHDIAVTASHGVITLTGFVDTYAETNATERTVKRVRGVRAVADDVEVKVRDERTDTVIAKDAAQALQSHTNAPDRVTVTVRRGRVTLEGTVEWTYQKAAAESAVKYLKGVRSVANLIRISQTAPSVEVKTRIEEALRRSAEIDAARVRVEADDSIVTLSGHVGSWAERQEAERAAWSFPGVAHVENPIVVAPRSVSRSVRKVDSTAQTGSASEEICPESRQLEHIADVCWMIGLDRPRSGSYVGQLPSECVTPARE